MYIRLCVLRNGFLAHSRASVWNDKNSRASVTCSSDLSASELPTPFCFKTIDIKGTI